MYDRVFKFSNRVFLLSHCNNREAAEKLDLDLRTSEPGEARAFRSFQLSFDDQVVVVVKTS